MSFYLVASVIFSAIGPGIFNSYLPGQRFNTTTNSFEAANTDPSPSIWGNQFELNSTLGKYGNTSGTANPGAMLDPTAIVGMVGFYIGFLYDMVSSTLLTAVLNPFIGSQWAHILTFILNICATLVIIRVVTGRIRWD